MIPGQPNQQQVIDAFFKEHFRPLCNYAYRYLKNEDDAEDIVIELLHKILKDTSIFSVFINHANPKGYLYASIYNNCLSKLRKHKQFKIFYSSDEQFADSIFNTNDWANTQYAIDILEYIHEEISNLPLQQKRIITLVFDEDLSEKEIAEQTGLSLQVVQNYKNRAINKIKIALLRKGLITIILFYCLFSRN